MNLVAASAAVALQVLLVPRYQLVGSAVATVAAMACGQLLLAIVPASRPAVLASWRAALPAIGIGLGAQGVVTALGVSGLLAAVSTVVVFGLGVWLTGLVGPDDLVALRAAVARARER